MTTTPRQKMHWCTAKVNLSGQNLTIIWFDKTNPISWPEAQVLMAMHGEENVYEVKPISIADNVYIPDEKERLAIKYGFAPTEHVFPGRQPRMETLMPGESEDQPPADEYGVPMGVLRATGSSNGHPIEEPPAPSPTPTPPMPEDEDAEEEAAPLADVSTPASFKPGKHQRPAKGA